MKKLVMVSLITFFTSCEGREPQVEKKENTSQILFTGTYVDEGYAKKTEGYDWVAATITAATDSTWHISVRSRADKKKPTCRFDADLVKIDDYSLASTVDGKKILFRFTDSTLSITTEKKEDVGLLSFYCSGGASLAGNYHKINEALDTAQIDKKVFSKLLSLQHISFDIWTVNKTGGQLLFIQPAGLKTDNRLIEFEVKGTVTDAEMEDLNIDGSPEVLVYIRSTGDEHRANVFGISVNNGKSFSMISFPEKDSTNTVFKGYCGNDAFTIVENRLVQRFRICLPEDKNNQPSGKYRQISYRLVNGEAGRKFLIDKVTEIGAGL